MNLPLPLRSNRQRSTLDRAIIASVLAMVAMNIVVLAQQLHGAEGFALVRSAAAVLA